MLFCGKKVAFCKPGETDVEVTWQEHLQSCWKEGSYLTIKIQAGRYIKDFFQVDRFMLKYVKGLCPRGIFTKNSNDKSWLIASKQIHKKKQSH